MMNQHYAFWNAYYEEELLPERKFTDEDRKRRNLELTERIWKPGPRPVPLQEQSVPLKVCYPGLAIGLGQKHINNLSKQEEDKGVPEIQMGFTLDPVTGLPVLPGTSVKGLLRSAFLWTPEIVLDVLREKTSLELTPDQLKELELDIFGAPHSFDPAASGRDEHRQGRDVFLDAYPVQPDSAGHLLDLDFITPHLSADPAYDELIGPNPNAFLKILPGAVMLFRFLLKDSRIKTGSGETLSLPAADKLSLFRELLLIFGAGAKTNTGYGLLEDCGPLSGEARYLVQKEGPAKAPGQNTGKAKAPAHTAGKAKANAAVQTVRTADDIRPGMILEGTVENIKPFGVFVRLIPGTGGKRGVNGLIRISQWDNRYVEDLNQETKQGDTVRVKVISIDDSGKISLSRKEVL